MLWNYIMRHPHKYNTTQYNTIRYNANSATNKMLLFRMAVSVVCVLNDDVCYPHMNTPRSVHVYLRPSRSCTCTPSRSCSLIPFHFVSSLALTGISFAKNAILFMWWDAWTKTLLFSGWDKIRRIARINEWHWITIFLWPCASVLLPFVFVAQKERGSHCALRASQSSSW